MIAGSPTAPFLVAGHICIDLTPQLRGARFPRPGELVEAGSLRVSTGGAVSNVGFALSRLGCAVRLAGLVGDDWLGERLVQLLAPLGPQPGVRIAQGHATSYSIVVAPASCDRTFLHHSGPNTIFTSADVRDADLHAAAWLHFGYPPIMPAITANGGRDLGDLMRRACGHGLRTSLDFCSIAVDTDATDWREVLRNCAPYVTVFAPSIEELRAALRRPPQPADTVDDAASLACELLDMGFAIAVIKLGCHGLYVSTTDSAEVLSRWRLGSSWCARELWAPCFHANFVNACGAGDCTIAGLIASIQQGSEPEEALTLALSAGASSVEAADASSGVRSIDELRARIAAGWERLPAEPPGANWKVDPGSSVWHGATARTRSHAGGAKRG